MKNAAKNWHVANLESSNLKHKEWLRDNNDKVVEYNRKHYFKYHSEHLKQNKEYRLNNLEKVRERNRYYSNLLRTTNPELALSRVLRSQKKRHKKLMDSDPNYRLNRSMSAAVYACLKNNKKRVPWDEVVGYTVLELKSHLEKQFDDGMTWENYGEWHVDHIIPLAAFTFTTPTHIDFRRCWGLSNLRPLWARLNHQKGSKLDKPFQPSLPFTLPQPPQAVAPE